MISRGRTYDKRNNDDDNKNDDENDNDDDHDMMYESDLFLYFSVMGMAFSLFPIIKESWRGLFLSLII